MRLSLKYVFHGARQWSENFQVKLFVSFWEWLFSHDCVANHSLLTLNSLNLIKTNGLISLSKSRCLVSD